MLGGDDVPLPLVTLECLPERIDGLAGLLAEQQHLGQRVVDLALAASRISSAARTARSASSSCTAGTPKTAITASPMNFSTVPPWYSTICFIRSKYDARSVRSRSGSTDSPRAVEPVRSQKRMVTVLRCSGTGPV
jgi:hypothetical protein